MSECKYRARCPTLATSMKFGMKTDDLPCADSCESCPSYNAFLKSDEEFENLSGHIAALQEKFSEFSDKKKEDDKRLSDISEGISSLEEKQKEYMKRNLPEYSS